MIRVLSLFLLLAAGAFLILNPGFIDLSGFFDNGEGNNVEEVEEVVVEVIENVSTSTEEEIVVQVDETIEPILPAEEPVRTTIKLPSSSLTEIGTFIWTNNQRAFNGVQPLKRSPLLDEVAESKLQDMFDNQYFAHEAPDGDFVGDIASEIGYEYIIVGENLALGDFDNDETLLEAWMDSPGHRDNILNERYRELGVAVGRGEFDGRITWLAVQSFGTPLSICGVVDDSLLEDITDGKDELNELEEILSVMIDDIESTFPKSGPEYKQKVDSYNLLVKDYNDLLRDVNSWVKIYNTQVKEFNSCVDGI